MSEEMGSCRSEEGITEGLIDGMIAFVRILKDRDLSSERIQGALEDFFTDPDLRKIRNALLVED